MAAQAARAMVIKIEKTPGVFVAVGGLRSKTISINEGMVDASDADSPGRWRELLEGAEIRSVSISGSGIFKDSEGEELARARFFASNHPTLQFVMPGQGTYQGKFQCTKLELSGDYNKEANYSMSFESNGEVTFTAN